MEAHILNIYFTIYIFQCLRNLCNFRFLLQQIEDSACTGKSILKFCNNGTALIEEMIGNQKVVQAFGYEEKSSERFAKVNEELQECSLKAVFYSSLTNPSTRFVNNIIYACVALVGAFIIPGGRLTVGGLSVLLSYANQYMKPFNDISSVVTAFRLHSCNSSLTFAKRSEDFSSYPKA